MVKASGSGAKKMKDRMTPAEKKCEEIGQAESLKKLQEVLEKQIELVRSDNYSELEDVSQQAQVLVEQLVQAGITDRPEFDAQKQQLSRLYNQLLLSVSSRKSQIGKDLSRFRLAGSVLKRYQENL